MKFLWKKYIIIAFISLVLIAAGLYLQYSNPNRFISIHTINHLDLSNSVNNKDVVVNGKLYHIVKQKTVGYEQYSNPNMNISFIYPASLIHKQITPQLVALSDPKVKDTDDNTLYIYSTTVPENSISFKIPFNIPGSLKQTKIIKTQTFTANQEIYSDGVNEITLLVLRQKDQTIVLRIPPNSKNVSQAITDIMNSIKTLH